MRRISSIAFEKCIKSPSSALSSREADCVQKTALRFLDTRYFLLLARSLSALHYSKFISDSFMQQNN